MSAPQGRSRSYQADFHLGRGGAQVGDELRTGGVSALNKLRERLLAPAATPGLACNGTSGVPVPTLDVQDAPTDAERRLWRGVDDILGVGASSFGAWSSGARPRPVAAPERGLFWR